MAAFAGPEAGHEKRQEDNKMKMILKIVLPVAAILAAIAFSIPYFTRQPITEKPAAEVRMPLVAVAPVRAESMNIPVYTRGTVTPSTQIHMVSEVSGEIVEISPGFSNGGFFKKGDVLVRVSPLEYDVAIKRAEASRAQAYQAYLQAQAEKKARSMGRSAQGNTLANFEVQVRQAEAQYLAANAELEAVKMQRERTTMRAPFDGRVLTAGLNVGQYLRPGTQMGIIYAVDVAEVRLPLSDRQLGMVDVPTRMSEAEQKELPDVIFTEEFAGKTFTWKGKVVRAEGGVDERNRLLYVIAHVPDPYGVDPAQPGRPELVAGSFVEAKIAGRKFERVFAIPRKSLRNGSQVWVVGDDSRLSRRDIGVLYKAKDTVYVSTGLDDGEQIVLNQLDIAVEGMRVRAQIEENPDQIQEEATAGENPFASTKPVEPAVSAPFKQASPTGLSVNISEDKTRELAEKAKDYYENLDDNQKDRLKENASKLAKQIGALQGTIKQPEQSKEPSTEEVQPAQTAAADAARVEPQSEAPANSVIPAQPESPSSQAMSPLAAQFEQDMAQPAPEPVEVEPEKPAAATPEPATTESAPAAETAAVVEPASKPESAPQPAGVIATVAAPKPLVESSQ